MIAAKDSPIQRNSKEAEFVVGLGKTMLPIYDPITRRMSLGRQT
jgi:hypothetical protein